MESLKSVTFRIANHADLPNLVTLINSAYRGESSKKGWTTEADLLGGQRVDLAMLQEIVSREHSFLIMGDSGTSKPVACVHLLKKDEKTAYLGLLTISPELQAGGMGSELLKFSEKFCAEKLHSSVIEMTVITLRTELVAWYERRGFKQSLEKRPFPKGDPKFGLPKREDLVFVVMRKEILTV